VDHNQSNIPWLSDCESQEIAIRLPDQETLRCPEVQNLPNILRCMLVIGLNDPHANSTTRATLPALRTPSVISVYVYIKTGRINKNYITYNWKKRCLRLIFAPPTSSSVMLNIGYDRLKLRNAMQWVSRKQTQGLSPLSRFFLKHRPVESHSGVRGTIITGPIPTSFRMRRDRDADQASTWEGGSVGLWEGVPTSPQ